MTRLDYQLSHGESSFPVASSTWSGKLELPAKGHALLNFDAHFESPPMEPESSLLHLAGDLSFVDKTGYLGLRRLDLTHTSFQSQIQATRSSH